MPHNSLVTRDDAAALIPEDVSREILKEVPQSSTVMRLARRLPNMARAQRRMPVLAGLITAYFVQGDTGLKQTSELLWANKYINAAELAVIVPIPETVIDDVDYDIWGEIRPEISAAFGRAFDAAVLYGTNAPADWPTGVVPAAVAAGHSVTLGGLGADIFDDIFAPGGVLSFVEEDGFSISGHVAHLTLKARLRGLRDNTGQPIFMRTPQAATGYELDGTPVEFPTNGSVDAEEALLISGDWRQLVYAMRQDLTYKVLTEAVIQDSNGTIIYNLPQQDMVALRATMRLGWQVPNPLKVLNQDEGTRYPFSVLLPQAGL